MLHLLRSKAHAETGQVSVGEGEEDHEDDVPGIMVKPHREVVTRLNIAQHEERDEDEPHTHKDMKPDAVLTRLEGNMATSTTGTNRNLISKQQQQQCNTVGAVVIPHRRCKHRCVVYERTRSALGAVVHVCRSV